MACSKCNGGGNLSYQVHYSGTPSNELKMAIANCEITKELLLKYTQLLECCKENNKLSDIGLSTIQYHSYMGYLQSALNYPDNYCYYIIKIQEFANNILPRIISNVTICTNKF